MSPEDIKNMQSRVTWEARDELTGLLQAWFDKYQPEAKRNFDVRYMPTIMDDCARMCEHALNWFAYGN